MKKRDNSGNSTARNARIAREEAALALKRISDKSFVGKRKKHKDLEFDYSLNFIDSIKELGINIPREKEDDIVDMFDYWVFLASHSPEYLLEIEEDFFNKGVDL